ncbi:MAG TPA: hypothetical protein VNL69_08360 [Bacteroidota bacterium]|nr:hypothetical protein [Bacteroidota bacterium]
MKKGIPLFVLLHLTVQLSAQTHWSLDYSITLPYNVPVSFTIQQQGAPDISFTPRFRSEPLVVPVTWVWKLSYWSDSAAWSLMSIHHKLYLNNRPPEVEEFAITHGYNIISIVRSWQMEHFMVGVGAGIVLAHPEVSVRGKRLPENRGIFNSGYYIAGPVFNFSVGKRLYLVGGLYVLGEAMVHASYASVPIVDGEARLFNIVGHASLGLGFALEL